MFDRDPKAWESVLGCLRESLERKILDVLQISFDGLKITEQKIFLDIACFFKGMTKYRVANILQILHHKPYIDIDVLVEKSLITIINEELWMHVYYKNWVRKLFVVNLLKNSVDAVDCGLRRMSFMY